MGPIPLSYTQSEVYVDRLHGGNVGVGCVKMPA